MTDNARFIHRRSIPDPSLSERADRLVGFSARFARIRAQLILLSDVEAIQAWLNKNHTGGPGIAAALRDRYPLAVFYGDVGTGKTATAETVASLLADELSTEGFLLKLSTRVRGVGHVGEMSTLISDAFDEANDLAGKKRFVCVLIDEGDSLAFNRGAERAHHEDRAGVNALIQKIDEARELAGRLLVLLATNRVGALDPAVIRRATVMEEFRRPDHQERRDLFLADLVGVSTTPALIDELVELTGPREGRPGFTFSDIQLRVLPAAIGRAFPERPLTGEDLIAAADETTPSPEMGGDAD